MFNSTVNFIFLFLVKSLNALSCPLLWFSVYLKQKRLTTALGIKKKYLHIRLNKKRQSFFQNVASTKITIHSLFNKFKRVKIHKKILFLILQFLKCYISVVLFQCVQEKKKVLNFIVFKNVKSKRVGRTGRLSTLSITNVKLKHLLRYLLLQNLKIIK